ncbi:MAG: hypothetical protein HPZ91_18755 [Lentisphaeria bacterium]|nr:hypothetical protein [Lentisphaeria bacterium]
MIRNAEEYTFSWSVRRQEIWNRCRRSYFLHYYAARGGHDEHADPELRRIHEMRSLLSESTYLRRLIAAELRGFFYAPHETEDPEFPERFPLLTAAVTARFHREFRRMLLGEFQRDHAAPMLDTLYGNLDDPGTVKARLERKLYRALDALESGVWPALTGTRFLHRRTIESPLAVTIGSLRCHAAPVLAFQERGVLSIVESSGADSTALLLRFHALNRLHIPPERVRTFELIPEEGVLRESGLSLNISRTLREIKGGATEMLNAIRPSGIVSIEDFPPDEESCSGCRFRSFCS